MAKNSETEAIKVYCRLRPLKNKEESIEHAIKKDVAGFDLLFVKQVDLFHSRHKQNNFEFQYHGIFDEFASQSSVFENVAAPILNKFTDGFNGTIFTYGQTGSGKTHTICGTNVDEGRGIIPRSFQRLFDIMATKSREDSVKYEISFSYFEIYNEIIYDLLKPNSDRFVLSDKSNLDTDDADYEQISNTVSFSMNRKGHIVFQNLTIYRIENLLDALVLIKDGDYRRKISPTPMNDQSSRSHCICTIYLTQKRSNSSKILKSKLNLVDLAGSERIWKSKVEKKTLSEARHINLSLHFLEQVIVALTTSLNKTHIPYRNSVMTSILRDSLGGNCFTAMIANLVLNHKCIGESLSTCRFAQRVASVENRVKENWLLDSAKEIDLLKKELALLKKQNNEDTILNEEEKRECENLVNKYLSDTSSEFKLPIGNSKIKYCFKLLKDNWCKIQIDKEDKISQMEPNLMCHDMLDLPKMIKQKVHSNDKNISILIHDQNKKQVMFASSDNQRLTKKIMKLPWDVYEKLNNSSCFTAAELDDCYRQSDSRSPPRGQLGDGDCRGSVAEMVSHGWVTDGGDVGSPAAATPVGQPTNTAVDAATNTMFWLTDWTCSHYFHVIKCLEHNDAESSSDTCFCGGSSAAYAIRPCKAVPAEAVEETTKAVEETTKAEEETAEANEVNGDDETEFDCVKVRLTGDPVVDNVIKEFYSDRAIEI